MAYEQQIISDMGCGNERGNKNTNVRKQNINERRASERTDLRVGGN